MENEEKTPSLEEAEKAVEVLKAYLRSKMDDYESLEDITGRNGSRYILWVALNEDYIL